jgi:rRNA-processing protein FCF1
MEEIIPARERRRIRTRKIKVLYSLGYTMDQIVEELHKLGMDISKTAVFFAIRGRVSKAKKAEVMRKKRAVKSAIINHINKTNPNK